MRSVLSAHMSRHDFPFHKESYEGRLAYKSIISDFTGSYGCPGKKSLPYTFLPGGCCQVEPPLTGKGV